MSAVLTVGGRDVSHYTVSDVTVQVGRDDVDSQPEASVLTAALVDGWDLVGDVGGSCTLADADGTMFTGTVSDVDCAPPDPPGGAWRARLVAAGPLADLGRVVVGDEPWPQETDSARVHRILGLAGAAHRVNPGLTGPDLLPRDVDAQPAAELCRSAAADALGTLWEQPADPAAPIRYTPQSLRAWNPVNVTWAGVDPAAPWSAVPGTWGTATGAVLPVAGAPPALSLDCSDIEADVVFSQRLGDLLRYVRVAYGTAPGAGERPEATAGTPGAVPQARRDGQLADVGGAQAVADTVWRSRREPAWRLTSVTLHREDQEAGEWAALRAALAVGTRLTIALPAGSPVGPVWQGYLEGWQLAVVDDMHTVTLRTSDRALTEPADRWQDAAPSLTWAAVTPAETWDTANGVG